MSNGDNFASGFITGAVLGGILGGVLGATLVSRSGQGKENSSNGNGNRRRVRRWISSNDDREVSLASPLSSEERIEEARNSLEDKIAQLNMAIDEARQQLNDTSPMAHPSNPTESNSAQ